MIENFPIWPLISLLLGVLYFCWLLFGGAFKGKVSQFFAKTFAILKALWAFCQKVIEKTQFSEDESPVAAKVPLWRNALEWLAIILPTWLYCLPFLDLGSSLNLPGSETEYFQAFDQVLSFSLKEHGQFPLWNPYFHNGMPYIAHPMLHAYNPFVTFPVLLFGVMDGFKIAVFLGFIIAGLGMWCLGKEVGLGGIARIWVSLMFVFSGVPAAKFIQGHYLLVLAFGWIPFSLAAILAATRRKQRKDICIAALSLSLLFFSGNAYYAYYMLYVMAIYGIVMLFKFGIRPIQFKINWGKIKVLFLIAALSLGLTAVQSFPLFQYRDHYVKAVNVDLKDSRDIPTVFMDFVSPEPFRPGAYSTSLRPEEFYAYVGWWPLVAILLLPLAWRKKNRRLITLFVLLIAFTFLWIDVKDMPWHELFQTNPVLFQFRYPSRMVVIGVIALVISAAFGLDDLLRMSFQNTSWAASGNRNERLKNIFFLLTIGLFMIGSLFNLAATSRPLLKTTNAYHNSPGTSEQAIAFLKKLDPNIFYLGVFQNWDQVVIGAKVRYHTIWDAITITPDLGEQISERLIISEPNYYIFSDTEPAPPNTTLLKTLDHLSIYKMEDSLPFAFTVDTSTISTFVDRALANNEVTPVTSLRQDINSIAGVVNSQTDGALVLLSNFSSDWQLTIDGIPEKIYNASGFMAASITPGAHYYKFIYQPVSFFVGLAITLVTLLVILVIWIRDTKKGIIKVEN